MIILSKKDTDHYIYNRTGMSYLPTMIDKFLSAVFLSVLLMDFFSLKTLPFLHIFYASAPSFLIWITIAIPEVLLQNPIFWVLPVVNDQLFFTKAVR